MADRDFKGVWIPKEIWLDKRLNALDKIILAEIDSLDNGDEHCHAGNDYLAQFCQCSTSKVTKTVAKLINLGYVKVHSFDGRIRKLRSCLAYCTLQDSKIYEADEQNVRPINISNNLEIKSISRKSAAKENPAGFDEFWSVYPRHIDKKSALRAWTKLKPSDELKQTIIADVRRRVNSDTEWTEEKYIPYPATYINGARWEDEPAQAAEPEKPHGLYSDNLSPEELMRRQKEQAEKDREEARRQGLL